MKFHLNTFTRPGLSKVVLGALVPALLIALPIAVLAGVTRSLLAGEHFPEAVVVLAFIGTLVATTAYFVSTPGWQPDEAGFRAAAVVTLSFVAAPLVLGLLVASRKARA